MSRQATHTFRPFRCSTASFLALVGVAQLLPAASERPEISYTEGRLEASPTVDNRFPEDERLPEESAFVDVSGSSPGPAAAPDVSGSSERSAATCTEHFGSLTEKMTIVDLDPEGGCVRGVDPQASVIHFAGGNDATCRPPVTGDGCHRFIVARYADDCDMTPVDGTVGQKVLLDSDKALIGKDGVFKQCNQAGALQMRTLLYIGNGGDADIKCNQDICGCTDADATIGGCDDTDGAGASDESIATRASSLWACYLFAATFTTWTL